MIQAYKYIEVS